MSLNILFAGDKVLTLPSMFWMLSDLGHRVVSAQTPQQILHKIQHQHFDLVLMDAHSPELNGSASPVIILAQKLARRDHTPVVAISHHPTQAERGRCISAGADHYMAQPADAAELGTLLSSVSDPESIKEVTRPANWSRTEAMERAGGNEQALHDLLKVFSDQKPRLLAKMSLAVQARHPELVEWTALKMAEKLSYLGVQDLASMARDIARLGSHREFMKTEKITGALQSRLAEMDLAMSRTQL